MTAHADEVKPTEIHHFIYVAQPAALPRYYGVLTIYWETDPLAAVGQVWEFVESSNWADPRQSVLNTNDGLVVIWASPEGNLWVGSTWGRMWTTADVAWDTSAIPELDWNERDPVFHWKATKTPPRRDGAGFSLSAIWGSSDQDVHVGTFEGVILHWNGARWEYGYTDNAKPVSRMHGTSKNNVWATGRDGLVLHFDGQHWRSVPLPGDASRGETLTGVWALSDDEVYICSTSGAIFHGSPAGLERLGEYPHAFYGIVELHGDLYLAGGDAGVCRLRGNEMSIIRNSFAATGVYRLANKLAFVEPSQEKGRVILYDPNAARPWIAYARA
jgi:hypothetical protein